MTKKEKDNQPHFFTNSTYYAPPEEIVRQFPYQLGLQAKKEEDADGKSR